MGGGGVSASECPYCRKLSWRKDQLAIEIKMPRFGLTMKQGKLSKWLKKEGDSVQKGEPLFEVETEKITNVVQSVGSGILFQIVVPAGKTVPVGAVLAILAEEGERPERIEGIQVRPAEDAPQAAAASGQPAQAALGGSREAYVPATPAAKRLARELGVDLSRVPATGREGRVTEEDVRRYHAQGPPRPKITPVAAEMALKAGLDVSALTGTGEGGKITKEDVERALGSAPPAARPEAARPRSIPFSGMRRAIAERMHASLHDAAQLTLFTEVDVTEMAAFLESLRQQKVAGGEAFRVSANDMVLLAVSRVLRQFPILNSSLVEEEILLHDRVDLGMAVALPDGLIVPKIRNADRKSLLEIAREARELARKAREGALTPDEVVDGTFTVTNLGAFGVDGFTPVLNPPETAILGVGRIVEKPAVHRGRIEARSFMTLSLTIDHRVVDGAPAAEFLQALARHLTHPTMFLVS